MPRNWTPESRQKARERCFKNKPWKHSTGPKTELGKARSSLNNLRHGLCSQYFRALQRWTTAFDRYQKQIEAGNSVGILPPEIPTELIEAGLLIRDLCEPQVLEGDS